MTNPTDPRIEAAARALCQSSGFNPDELSVKLMDYRILEANWKKYIQKAGIALKAADEAAWLPIESVPKDYEKVLLTDGKEVSQGWHDKWDQTFVRHDEARAGDGFLAYYDDWKPTHWMPLPKPPETR